MKIIFTQFNDVYFETENEKMALAKFRMGLSEGGGRTSSYRDPDSFESLMGNVALRTHVQNAPWEKHFAKPTQGGLLGDNDVGDGGETKGTGTVDEEDENMEQEKGAANELLKKANELEKRRAKRKKKIERKGRPTPEDIRKQLKAMIQIFEENTRLSLKSEYPLLIIKPAKTPKAMKKTEKKNKKKEDYLSSCF